MISIAQYRSVIGTFSSYKKPKIKNGKVKNQNVFISVIFLLLLLLSSQVENNHDSILQKGNNKSSHSLYGNNSNYNLLHWNKGNSYFHSKIDDIYYAIDLNKPDIFSIAEANYFF